METAGIKNVVLLGNGIMSQGMAQVFAQAGMEVSLVGRRDDSLQTAMQKIADNLDLFVEMNILSKAESEKAIRRIHPTKDVESACRNAHYLTEALPEEMTLKQRFFRQADKWCPENVILSSCTSSLSIEQIASVTNRPEKVLGNHWVNPAQIMQLVEVVRGPQTSDETVNFSINLLKQIGKVPAICKDSPAFLNNAMQFAFWKVALELYEKGIATAEDIEKAVNYGFGFRLSTVGPFRMLDMGGLDPFKAIWEYIDSKTGNLGPFPRFLQNLIDEGHLGFKTGKGFYEYSEDEIKNLTRSINRALIKQMKALERIN